MKMVYSEGTVAVYDNEGYELEVEDNLKLQDGDSMKTEADSLAYIALDQDRFVTLMQQSSAEFIKKGKKLKLDLTKGRIFFNIDSKLKSGESLDICTSSMIVGIRGTSGYIDTDEHGARRTSYIRIRSDISVTVCSELRWDSVTVIL